VEVVNNREDIPVMKHHLVLSSGHTVGLSFVLIDEDCDESIGDLSRSDILAHVHFLVLELEQLLISHQVGVQLD